MQDREVRIVSLERFAAIIAEDREAFRGEHRILLTAQVALVEAQTKTETRIDQLAEATDKLGAEQAHIEQNLREATEKLDALIDLMDRHLREQGDKPQ